MNLETYEFNDTIFRKQIINEILRNDYRKSIAILKSSRLTFFPEVICFNSERELLSIKFKTNLYDFYYDFASEIEQIDRNIDSLNLLNKINSAKKSTLVNLSKKELRNQIIYKYQI